MAYIADDGTGYLQYAVFAGEPDDTRGTFALGFRPTLRGARKLACTDMVITDEGTDHRDCGCGLTTKDGHAVLWTWGERHEHRRPPRAATYESLRQRYLISGDQSDLDAMLAIVQRINDQAHAGVMADMALRVSEGHAASRSAPRAGFPPWGDAALATGFVAGSGGIIWGAAIGSAVLIWLGAFFVVATALLTGLTIRCQR